MSEFTTCVLFLSESIGNYTHRILFISTFHNGYSVYANGKIEQYYKKTWTTSGGYTYFNFTYLVKHTQVPIISATVKWDTNDSGNTYIWVYTNEETFCTFRAAPNPSAIDLIYVTGY